MTDGASPVLAELAGDWTLNDAAGEFTCPITVPGDGISALAAAGLIPDPYEGRNEYDLRWIAERDWTHRADRRARPDTTWIS